MNDYAIVAVLSQKYEENNEYISRKSSESSETNYTTDKEMLVITWSVDKVNAYVRGEKEITVRTDYETLTFLKNCNFKSTLQGVT